MILKLHISSDRRSGVMKNNKNRIEDVAGCPIRSVHAVIAAKWPKIVNKERYLQKLFNGQNNKF